MGPSDESPAITKTSEREAADSTPHQRNATRVRILVTGDGRHWVVREMPSSSAERRGSGPGSLLFISERAIRRVRDYPTDWFDRSDDDLIAVSMHR